MGSPADEGSILAGKYRVERTIGAGGMGVVVEATDTRLERRVAIKFLLPEYAQHAEAASRFMREARAAVKIKSDHSARVIDVGTLESGSPYMVMEYLEGADLAQILERDGVLALEDAALYVIQACEAVAEAHSHGIVHRDLKPANLFLAKQPDGSMRIKVLDFGISKVMDTQVDHSLTRTSSMMGSPLYMSPEQMRSTRNVDLRTDIWALGVIFYEMVTGSLPFVANSVPELSAKVLLEEHDPISSRRADLPVELELVVGRALCKKAGDRYPSIAEFVMDLMPYAPQRARHNVERITKVLNAAGLSTSQFSASSPPPPMFATADREVISGQTLGGRMSISNAKTRPSGPAAPVSDATQVNFGQTTAPRNNSRLGLLAAILVGSVALVGAVVFFVLRPDTPPVVEPAKQPSAEVEPPLKQVEPVEPKQADPEPSAASVEPPAPSASVAEPEEQPEATPPVKPRVARVNPRVVRPPIKPIKPPPTSQPVKDEFGVFGGRK